MTTLREQIEAWAKLHFRESPDHPVLRWIVDEEGSVPLASFAEIPTVEGVARSLCWLRHPKGTFREIKRACDTCMATTLLPVEAPPTRASLSGAAPEGPTPILSCVKCHRVQAVRGTSCIQCGLTGVWWSDHTPASPRGSGRAPK